MFEFLAIAGALAWLPHLIKMIKKATIKPELEVFLGDNLEIGYTSRGPIVNINFAFFSSNKRSIIDEIELTLTHENNDSYAFSWNWLEETLYQVQIPESGVLPTKKNQNAIVTKIDENQLIEKKIGFQQNSFKEEKDDLEIGLMEEIIPLHNSGKDITEVKSKKVYNQITNHLENGFIWKVGEYTGELKIHVTELNSPVTVDFEFNINSVQYEALSNNIERTIKDFDYQNALVSTNGEEEKEEKEEYDIKWGWVYPKIL